MRMNQGVEWAVHACTLLAPLWPARGLSLAALAEFHGVPAPYMAKQMQLLSKAGIVRTSRGKSGGYALARDPAAISLWDVARAIDGALPAFRCTEIRQQGPCAAARAECRRPCQIAAAFAEAEEAWRKALSATTIAAIAADVASQPDQPHLVKGAEWMRANMTELPGG
jgi:Rrf2 family protein